MKVLIPDTGLTVTGPVHTATFLVSLKTFKTLSTSIFQVTFQKREANEKKCAAF